MRGAQTLFLLPLAGLAMHLGFRTFVRMAQAAMDWSQDRRGWRMLFLPRGGFRGCLSLVALRATRARDQDLRPALEGPLRLLRSSDAEYPLQLVVHPIHPVCGGVQVECPEERQR
jgi:hypothetical protein